MATYAQFYSSVLPGNYALTKSMELTKVQSSGTLWYTKKFLVLYYYIFLSNAIMTHEYVERVTECFDGYIASLPEAVRSDAERFFYPEEPAINFRSAAFRTFASFASARDFENQAARREYYQKAKKLYFAILMGSGGQTGVKKALKEAVSSPGFVYSEENIRCAILDGVVSVCQEQIVDGARLTDRSVKYILSQPCIDAITQASTREALTPQRIRQIIPMDTGHRPAFHAIENDMVAFIRNERQILYYYGYFHSKSDGAADFEFSSLTPIGELALKANSYEFLAIWEHQKIKMISQPATADINDIVPCENKAEQFSISFSPYTDIIGHILRQGSLSAEQYQYVVSRRKHTIPEGEWALIEGQVLRHIDDIKALLAICGRTRDQKGEDSRKELLKYLLGLRSDLPMDKWSHPYGVVVLGKSCACSDRERLMGIFRLYSKLQDYKEAKYGELFRSCEEDLRCRYMAALAGKDIGIDPHVKISWDLYNIRSDELILLAAMASIAANAAGIDLLDADIPRVTEGILNVFNSRFSGLLRAMGYRSDSAKRQIIRKMLTALQTEDYASFLAGQTEPHRQVLAAYRTADAADLRTRIMELSAHPNTDGEEGRVRNANLIGLMKSYYMAVYLENGTLRCECCGEEAFLTEAGEPYVEFHHLIPFHIANGPDHYLNLFALCPNCHRKLHFLGLTGRQQAYADLSANNYMQLKFVQRLRTLKDTMILRSYHLEYLLAERAITLEEYESIAG